MEQGNRGDMREIQVTQHFFLGKRPSLGFDQNSAKTCFR